MLKQTIFVDVFYKLRYKSEAVFSAVDLRPLEHSFVHNENSKVKRTDLKFHPNGVVDSKRWKNGKPIQDFNFDPDNLVVEPISAAFLARSLDWKLGDVKEFDVFDGKSRYLIKLKAQEKVALTINGRATPAWVIVPEVRKATENHNHKKLKSAKIYVTADAQREVVKLSSKVFVGTVNTTLKSFSPEPSQPMGAKLARMRAKLQKRIEKRKS